ncbi:MAG: MBOAT family O-acyltransferase [Pygmaiobacter massiliensis]|uniref:MBOAT family O-acyltransferase n=1 Tax=Pygmaiobacter massiliensis TaxID=1917873 RepID=UPI00289A4BD0|nr:MBOAT family O-acyltransferase [Pygmaiobacter massiliensis]
MSALATQVNQWLSGLWRYLELVSASTPITGPVLWNWLTETFRKGISFTSLSFYLFFPVCLLLFYLLPKVAKNFWLLVCSYLFYYLCTFDNQQKAHPEFLFLLAAVTLISYFLCIAIDLAEKRGWRRLLLALVVGIDLSLLIYYKYMGFFAEVLSGIFPSMIPQDSISTSLFLPVGISFYIFLSIGYAIDVYRKDRPAELNVINYALFVSFFPQIVSGPIARSRGLLDELRQSRPYNHALVNEGMRQMLWGFFKKLVLSNNAAAIVQLVFATPERFNGFELFCGSLFFTLQIYADFSGYSDMAIGSAKMLGLHLGNNFNRPYFSRSIGEFWDRWHISLSSWFQDYLYIPLGGSRKGAARACINVMIVFLLSGLWHGAAYTFIVWGGLHGAYTVLSRLTRGIRKWLRGVTRIERVKPVHALLQWVPTFLFVNFAWIFFRADSLKNAFTFFYRFPIDFTINITDAVSRQNSLRNIGFYQNNGPALLWCTLALFIVEAICYKTPPEKLSGCLPFILRLVLVYALLLAVLFFGAFGNSGFIYGAF